MQIAAHFELNGAEQATMGALVQFPLACHFMNIKPRALHIAQLALRIVPTRSATAPGVLAI